MDTNFETKKEEIAQKLKEKIATLECPICHDTKREFALGGGYFAHDLQQNLTSRQMGGSSIPTIPLICKNCGFIAEFAVGVLGFLPKNESPEKPNDSPKETQ